MMKTFVDEINRLIVNDIVIMGDLRDCQSKSTGKYGCIKISHEFAEYLGAYPDWQYHQNFGDTPSLPFGYTIDTRILTINVCVAEDTTEPLVHHIDGELLAAIMVKCKLLIHEAINIDNQNN